MTPPPALDAERLVLRPVSRDDADDLQRHFARWSIIQHLTEAVPWPYPENGVQSFLDEDLLPRIASGDAMAWVIVPKTGPLAGQACGLLEYRPNADDHRGFWIAEPLWGQGYMTEAVARFQDHVFFDLGVERLVVHNAVGNLGSRRVKQKTGAVLLGPVEMAHRSGNAAEQWEVTRHRWAALRGRT